MKISILVLVLMQRHCHFNSIVNDPKKNAYSFQWIFVPEVNINYKYTEVSNNTEVLFFLIIPAAHFRKFLSQITHIHPSTTQHSMTLNIKIFFRMCGRRIGIILSPISFFIFKIQRGQIL